MLARLTFYETDRPARQFLLEENEEYVVGREPSCSMPIPDETLSRRHAKLEFQEGEWRVVDLCSKNGTLVSGRPVNRYSLRETVWIEFGSVLACFDHVSQEALDADRRRLGTQWQTSVQFSREFRPSMRPEELLERVLESFTSVSGAERGFVMLTNHRGELQPMASRPPQSDDFTGSRSVVDRAFRENSPIVCSNVALDAQLGPQPSIVRGAISALACVPLRVGDSPIGVIYVDSREAGKHFTELDMEILQALADHAALVIGVARLRDNLVDLSDMLPTELNRDAPPDAALIDKVERLLPRLEKSGFGRGQVIAVAGADS